MSVQKKKTDFRNQGPSLSLEEEAREVASAVAQKAGTLASSAGEKADEAAAAIGTGMQSWAHNIRDTTRDMGDRGCAANAVADNLDSSGRYLQEEGLSGMAADVANVIRRHPFSAVLIGLALGYLVARTTARS